MSSPRPPALSFLCNFSSYELSVARAGLLAAFSGFCKVRSGKRIGNFVENRRYYGNCTSPIKIDS